jgi:hypothetical protein
MVHRFDDPVCDALKNAPRGITGIEEKGILVEAAARRIRVVPAGVCPYYGQQEPERVRVRHDRISGVARRNYIMVPAAPATFKNGDVPV